MSAATGLNQGLLGADAPGAAPLPPSLRAAPVLSGQQLPGSTRKIKRHLRPGSFSTEESSRHSSASPRRLLLRDMGRSASVTQHRREAGSNVYALYCALAVLLGLTGFCLTMVASYDEVCGDFPNLNYEDGTLTRWPSTISELSSDWSSARGRLFFGFMTVRARAHPWRTVSHRDEFAPASNNPATWLGLPICAQVSSALLFVSRMPYELDTLPLEEYNKRNPPEVSFESGGEAPL
jgi:hypothetical protein